MVEVEFDHTDEMVREERVLLVRVMTERELLEGDLLADLVSEGKLTELETREAAGWLPVGILVESGRLDTTTGGLPGMVLKVTVEGLALVTKGKLGEGTTVPSSVLVTLGLNWLGGAWLFNHCVVPSTTE